MLSFVILLLLEVRHDLRDLLQLALQRKEPVLVDVHRNGVEVVGLDHFFDHRLILVYHRLHVQLACLADRREGVCSSVNLREQVFQLTD